MIKRTFAWTAGGVLFLGAALAWGAEEVPSSDPLRVIGFGSCHHQSLSQNFWEPLLTQKPGLFIFAGDNIYSDTYDMELQRAKYAQLGALPGYQQLKALCPILATWDDHDYGLNDSGADFPSKEGSRQNFLDFFEVPADSPRRAREGIYDAQVFGPEGRRVQVILLDLRWFLSPMHKLDRPDEVDGKYGLTLDTTTTLLGEAQWAWLEEQLRVPAEVRLLVSSIQVVADEHYWERWGALPHEQQRLYDLIRRTGAEGLVILSGDRHQAELSRKDDAIGYPLYDLTSSGLNKARRELFGEKASYRVGRPFQWDNFGILRLDWDSPAPAITLQVYNTFGRPVISETVPLSLLKNPRL
jgi:alkaline phosphatase D